MWVGTHQVSLMQPISCWRMERRRALRYEGPDDADDFFSFFCFAKRAKIIDPNSVWWQWMQLNLLHNKKQFDNQQLFKKGASSCLRGTPTWRLLSNRAAIYYHLSPRFMCQLLLWWIHESDIKTLNTFHSSKERNLKLTLVWFQTSGGI